MSWLKKLLRIPEQNPYQEGISPEFAVLLDHSRLHLAALTQGHQAGWRFGEHERWGIHQDEGLLRFNFADGLVAEAPAQAVGSFSQVDGTWLWAWANPSIGDELKRDALKVRQYGEEHSIPRLTTPQWRGDPEWAWSMTAFAAMHCGSQGAFCGTMGPMLTFLTFGEPRLYRAGEDAGATT